MDTHIKDQRQAALEIAYRRRALRVNSAIYARRHGPGFLPLLTGGGVLRARYIAELARLESEKGWCLADARWLADIAQDIASFGRLRQEISEACGWHADRLRELVRQHAAIAQLENVHRPLLVWPRQGTATEAHPRRRKQSKARRRRS
jgi:hypothetical protein